MLAKGHITAGVAAYTGMTMFLMTKVPSYTPDVAMIGAGLLGTLIGSLLPDIDSPNSQIGQLVPLVSHTIGRVFGHRTITHNLFFILSWVYLAYRTEQHILWALAWAVFIHILMDSFSRQGVPWLYPIIRKKVSFGWYRVKRRSKLSRVILFVAIIIGALVLIQWL